MNRWTAGILAGFGVMLFVNGLFLYLALHNPVQVVESYEREAR